MPLKHVRTGPSSRQLVRERTFAPPTLNGQLLTKRKTPRFTEGQFYAQPRPA